MCKLTMRELEVLDELAKKESDVARVAAKLRVTEAAVYMHLKRIRDKREECQFLINLTNSYMRRSRRIRRLLTKPE